jgi:outer membrane protein assembly factor BamC
MFNLRLTYWRALACCAVVTVMAATGCSNTNKRIYEESTFGRPLEVPPDLTRPSYDEALELSSTPATVPVRAEPSTVSVLPDQANMVLARDGAQRWLVLNGEPAQVWPWVRNFWLKKGFALRLEDPATGVIETEWAQQQSIPVDAARAATEGKVYAVPLREKYRVRFERGEKAGTTEIYLTHRGAELSEQDKMLAWHMRPSDPELEVEALKQLMVFLGVEQEKAGGVLKAPQEIVRRATLNADAQGTRVLHIDEDFARSWRRVELALDRLGYRIEDRDRSRGVFYVQVENDVADLNGEKKKSWFARWFGGAEAGAAEYQIVLKDEGAATNIYARNKAGEPIDNTNAEPVLKQLQERLQ